jgi:tripartite-type tricarboxylate transporter receptor subunit TctC
MQKIGDRMGCCACFRVFRVVPWLVLLFLFNAGSWAQSYPAKPVRLISPYPPGGGTDATARIIAQAMGDQMGRQDRIASE